MDDQGGGGGGGRGSRLEMFTVNDTKTETESRGRLDVDLIIIRCRNSCTCISPVLYAIIGNRRMDFAESNSVVHTHMYLELRGLYYVIHLISPRVTGLAKTPCEC